MNDPVVIPCPVVFFFALAVLFIGFGMWLDRILLDWQIKCLRRRVSELKTELLRVINRAPRQ